MTFYSNNDSISTRSYPANGGGSSNIFGHYQDEEDQDAQRRRAAEIERVQQSASQTTESLQTNNYSQTKDDFAANQARNRGGAAPFAVGNNMVDSPPPRRQPPPAFAPSVAQDYRGGDYAANRARNLGSGAPFATGESMVERKSVRQSGPSNQFTPQIEDYRTPKEKQAGNPNLNRNTFQDLFGVQDDVAADNNRSQAKASTHNPVTWEAYSNYDAEADQPAHRSRYQNSAQARQGGSNPLNPGVAPSEEPARHSAKEQAQGTISNITF